MTVSSVLFDLDGTLLNTLDDLADSANYALAQMGYPARTREEVRQMVGNGVKNLILRACPAGTPPEAAEDCLRVFRAHYKDNMQNKTRPYPGILPLLTALRARGIQIGVVSNKFDGAVKPLCKKYFGDLVDLALGEQAGVPRKPDPGMIREALRQMGARAGGAVYSGDSDVDVLTAKNAGLACVAVSWGFRSRESLVLAGAEQIADAPEDFLRALDSLE